MMLRINSKVLVTSLFVVLFSATGFTQQATLTIHEDPNLASLLHTKKELEKENRLAVGYTVQLYYGELNQANQILKKYRSSFSDWPASLEYETPNYKVWAGNFASRIEAERALIQIQEKFSSAFILKPDRKK